MKIKQKQKNLIESVLKKVYSDYKDKGILSIYLWGTVLTDDFNPRTSDIDSIAIVSNKAKPEDNDYINGFLEGHSKELKNFKLNYIYLDDLNGGKIKSNLAKVIDPRLLLLDFENWKHVAGKTYSRKNFKLKEITFDNAVRLELLAIRKRFLPLFKQNNFEYTPYFTKYLIMVCYYLNQKESGKHRFSYNELLERSPKNRKSLVKILLNLKKNNWDQELMKDNLSVLLDFINSLPY